MVSGLARTVLPHHTERLAPSNFEAYVVQGPEVFVPFEAIEGQQFLQPVARCVVDRVAFGNSLKFNGVHSGEKETPV